MYKPIKWSQLPLDQIILIQDEQKKFFIYVSAARCTAPGAYACHEQLVPKNQRKQGWVQKYSASTYKNRKQIYVMNQKKIHLNGTSIK